METEKEEEEKREVLEMMMSFFSSSSFVESEALQTASHFFEKKKKKKKKRLAKKNGLSLRRVGQAGREAGHACGQRQAQARRGHGREQRVPGKGGEAGEERQKEE